MHKYHGNNPGTSQTLFFCRAGERLSIYMCILLIVSSSANEKPQQNISERTDFWRSQCPGHLQVLPLDPPEEGINNSAEQGKKSNDPASRLCGVHSSIVLIHRYSESCGDGGVDYLQP